MIRGRGRVVSTMLLAGLTNGPICPGAIELQEVGKDEYRILFSFNAPSGTGQVFLAGSFNGWNPRAMAMSGPDHAGTFHATIVLPKGRHEYKFVIDGANWQTDPDNPYRSERFGNAIVYAGVLPDESATRRAATAGPAAELVRTLTVAAHPEAVERLREGLVGRSTAEVEGSVREWFGHHPMPLFTASSVSFVSAVPDATGVSISLAVEGSRTSHPMERLVAGHGVFAISLDRTALPEGAAYGLIVETPSGSQLMDDPHAWSMTSRWGTPAALVVEASERRGKIEVIRGVGPSSGRLLPRDVYIYLPPGYDGQAEARYPVLYMHDGQNLWDDPLEPFGHGGWHVHRTADRLINAGRIEPFIGVGLANTADRIIEYGPGPDVCSDEGHPYLQLLKGEVKPMIDARYRTLPDGPGTALMGASMGGDISLQGALLNPRVFGQAACLSPAFVFRDKAGRDYLDLVRTVGKRPVRVYIDHDTAGSPAARAMVDELRGRGWQDGRDLEHFEDPGGEHNERSWRARLEKPLVFLFGRER